MIAAGDARIEIVLPLKPLNPGRGSDLLRAEALLASLGRFCDPDFVRVLTLVVPRADLDLVAHLPRRCALPLEVCAEEELFAPPPKMPRHGWYVQQLIKIAYAARCRTRFYLTLDADCVLIDFLDARILADGRAPWHQEPFSAHPEWWAEAQAVLAAPRGAREGETVFGVTPAFIATAVMQAVIARLGERAAEEATDWIGYLAARATQLERSWTEYSLYWTTLLNLGDPALLHAARPVYWFSHDIAQTEHAIEPGANRQGKLFAVVQSSFADAAAHAAFVARLLDRSEAADDPRRAWGLNGGYRAVSAEAVQAVLEARNCWLASAGAGGIGALAAVVNGAEDWMLRRFPAPLPVRRPGFRALYVFDAPAQAVAAACASGLGEAISFNNNLNFAPAWRDAVSLPDYAACGQDLLNLADHFTAWSDPDGPLRAACYPVLIVRRAALARLAGVIGRWFGAAAGQAARGIGAVPAVPAQAGAVAAMYAALARRIDAFGDGAMWCPERGRLVPIEGAL